MASYATPAVMQLYMNNSQEDEYLTKNPNITFFKKTYVNPEIFIKDEMAFKDIPMKWNDTTFIKIPKDIHLLGNIWATVNIPYFQILEKTSSTTTTTTNNAAINEMIYDNYLTYLVYHDNKYYLIPIIFYQFPDLLFNIFTLKFIEIKEYFNYLTQININDDTDIIMYSFNMNGFYAHDIIPTLLNLSNTYDKLSLNTVLNGKDRYKQNLLCQNSYDNYITNIIENEVINQYQNISKFDSIIDSSYYNFMSVEFDVLFNNGTSTTSDVYLVNQYINTSGISTVNTIDTISKDTITKTSLVLEYIVTDLNPSFEKTYTFYKKYATILTPSIYNFTLFSYNIIDVDSLGGNLIQQYYPNYAVSLNFLPFTLTTNMTITTVDGLTVTYIVEGGYDKLKISDSSTVTILDNIKMIINTNNNTLNDININLDYVDTNKNNEWTDNLLINLGKLDYNNQLEVLLFYQFKKNYYLKENVIKNNLLTFSSSVDSIKAFWIQLKVISDKYKERNANIGFLDTEFNTKIIQVNYPYIINIESEPQDIFNVYAIIINRLFDTLKRKYFSEISFIQFFYNKINSFLYQRFINISKMYSLTDFNGLLFYMNIDLLYYISKDIIKDYLSELFSLESYIGYIPLTLTPLDLVKNNINYYTDNYNITVDTSSYFHELKYNNVNYYTNDKYVLPNIGNVISIKKEYTNYLFYKSNFVEFQIVLNPSNPLLKTIIDVITYTLDDKYLNLTFNNPNNNDLSSEFYLYETIKTSIPIVKAATIITNEYDKVVVYDKIEQIDLFIAYLSVSVDVIPNVTLCLMVYTINNTVSTYLCKMSAAWQLLGVDGANILPLDYKSYDKIELYRINLPTTDITITNAKLAQDMETTYPNLTLLKSALTGAELALFTKLNTFKLTNGANTYNMVIIDEDVNNIYLYVYDTNVLTTSTTLTATIYNNSNMPNLFEYTSLDTNICETNDYFIQKPMIINIENDNIYLFFNMPKMLTTINISSNVYIDNKSITKIYNLDSNQILQDLVNVKLCSTYYQDICLTDVKYKNDIYNTVINIYNGLYEDIYKTVIDTIESSQQEYINSHNEILNYVQNTLKLGQTVQKMYNYASLLNEYNLTSSISTVKINLNDYNLIDFDSFTALAMSLYNFTNKSGNVLTVDNTIISALAYKFNATTKKIINSPWHNYKPYVKINPEVINYFDRYSLYAQTMLSNVINNQSALIVVNNENFPQNYDYEYNIKGNYYKMICNTDKFYITLSSVPALDTLKTANNDITLTINNNNTVINVDYDGTNYTVADNNIVEYQYKQIYDKTPLNNMDNYYKLVGAISIVNNKINSDFTLPELLVVDNNVVISTNTELIFNNNYNGININSYKLELSGNEVAKALNYSPKLLNYYLIEPTIAHPFVVGNNYIITINNVTGYLKVNGTKLEILMSSKILFTYNTTILWEITSASLSDIFLFLRFDLYGQLEAITNSYTAKFNIYRYSIFNLYLDEVSPPYVKYIIYNDDEELLYQQYNDQISILDVTLVYIDTPVTTIFASYVIIYKEVNNDNTLLPPIFIDSTINFYNSYDILKNVDSNSWIKLHNTSNDYEFQMKDYTSQVFVDGNYLFYNCASNSPIILKHPDIYKEELIVNNVDFNVYENKITLTTPLVTTYPLLEPNLSNGTYTINNVLINNIDNLDIYLEPVNQNIRINLVITDGVNNFDRPIIITTTPTTLEYSIDTIGVNPLYQGQLDNVMFFPYSSYVDPFTSILKCRITKTGGGVLTSNLYTYSNFIDIINVGGLGTVFEIYIKKDTNFGSYADDYHLIEIFNENNEKIYLWLYLVNTAPVIYNNLQLVNGATVINFREPYYYNYNGIGALPNSIKSNDYTGAFYYDYVYIDTKYFTLTAPDMTEFNLPSQTINITITNDNYLNFDETYYITNSATVTNINDNNLASILNTWSYLYKVDINGYFINDIGLQQYKYFIFVNNNKLYYNEKKYNTDIGIELLYEMPNNVTEGEVYIYNYKPIFINFGQLVSQQFNYLVIEKNAYIYCDLNDLQRNQIIKVNNDIIQITRWSDYYNCYLGVLINKGFETSNNAGYYSFGIFTNIYNKNLMLKNINTNYNSLFYLDTKANTIDYMYIGDYYIDTNVLYQYTSVLFNNQSNYFYKLPIGVNINIMYVDGEFYYDETCVYLRPLDSMVYNNNIYVIDSLDGNKITFKVAPVVATQNLIFYVPYQPFQTATVDIINNTIITTEYNSLNGWIEIYGSGIYPVINGILDGVIADNTYTLRIIKTTEGYIKCDFNNYVIYEESSQFQEYKNLPIKIICTANLDETYVYFTSNITFPNIKYIYNQSILINNIWYQVINFYGPTSNTFTKIYINELSSITNLQNIEYELIFSACNVNDNYLLSNNFMLRNTAKIEYPKVLRNIDTLTGLFNGYYLYDNFYTFNFTDIVIPELNTPVQSNEIISAQLIQQLNQFINNNNIITSKYYYFENYIPTQIDIGNPNNYNEVPLTITGNCRYESDYFNYILLKEITADNYIYQHYVRVNLNNNLLYIANSVSLINKKTSFFFLHNVIPCQITEYDNIILLNPDYNLVRPINVFDRKKIDMLYKLKVISVLTTPVKSNKKWKYYIKIGQINSNLSISTLLMKELLINNIYSCTIEATVDPTKYYIYSDNYINNIEYLSFMDYAYIDAITKNSSTLKNEFNKIDDDNLSKIVDSNSYKFKQVNRLFLSIENNQYLLQFKDDMTGNINIGDIDNTNSIGLRNTITYSSIDNNNFYILTTKYLILDIDSIPKKYNIITNYSRNNPLYYIVEPEISTTIPSLEAFLNDETINMTSIVNQYKDWKNWTLITLRYNTNLEPYLENYDLVYDGFNYITNVSTSYFTSDEITKMKAFMKFMFKNNTAILILNELYLVEQYLLNQLTYYITQKYFWKDIINIIKKIVANYNGMYSWTITNNVLCIEDEFINYPSNFTLINANNISYYVRNNYLSRDFDIYYNTPNINDITIGRDPSLIDTNIINYTTNINLYGTNINNIIITLLDFSNCMNTIPSTLSINFNYMDSNLYLIANIFNKVNSNSEYDFNNLSKLNRIVEFNDKNTYYGKYYDNLFNTKYFGVDGFNQYNILSNSSDITSIYVKDNIIYDLYSSVDTNYNNVNKLQTNNIFKYTIKFDNKGYESNEIIKSSNKYIVDIKDNFNHMVDPLIENAYINTDNLSFDTTEMVQPTDISIISNEYYTIINDQSSNYGYLFDITINGTFDLSDSSYKLYYNDTYVLYFDNNGSTYSLAFNNVVDSIYVETVEYDETILQTTIYLPTSSNSYYEYIYANDNIYSITRDPNISYKYTISSIVLIEKNNNYLFYKITAPLKISYKVVVKSVIKSSNKTFLTFSSNYNSSFIYIIINNIPYELVTLNDLIYIDELVNVDTNELYEIFINVDILTYTFNNYKISDLLLDRDISPIKYNQTDNNLPLSFTVDNCSISNLSILTNNKLRIKYSLTNVSSVLGNKVTHIYRLNESIPYIISSISVLNQFYYELKNNWNIRLTDSVNAGGNNANIYKVTESTVYFYLTTYILSGSLAPPALIIVKDYFLNVISYIGTKMIADIPSGLVNSDNIFEIIDLNNNIYPATISFGKYLEIITDPGIILTNIRLRQTIVPTTFSIIEPINNQAFNVITYNDTQYENLSPYFIPVIQTLDNSLNEFDAKYFYKFDYNSVFTFSTHVNVYNDEFINCVVVMVQDTYAIIGSNTYIIPGTYTIYSNDFSENMINRVLIDASYMYIKGEILEQTSGSEYIMLFPNGSLYDYDIFENTTNNNNILTFKYTVINLYNNSYKYVGFNKVPDTISKVTNNTTNYYDVEWIDNMAIHLFKSIEFIIDDVIIEKYDSDIYTIFGNYILSMFKREEGKNLYSIRKDSDGNFYLNLVIPLFFTYTYQYLPISNMNNSTIKIKFVLNSLSNLIKNNKKSEANYTNYVNPSIDFNYSFMTTDKMILDYFKNKELLISNFYYYQNYLLNKPEEYNHISLLTKVREIFFITKTKDNLPKLISTKEYDVWYSEYLSNNINDEYIFNLIDAEIEAKTNRYLIMSSHPIINKYDVRFAMYLDTKYLVYINENLNNTSLKYSYKLTVLSLYFTNNYKNETINTPVNIIDSLNILLNGTELLPELPSNYHNYVIPYIKGMELPKNYHMYGFNYYGLTTQPNGFINMKLIKDFLIYTKQSDINAEYRLKICTREYKVLKIDNYRGIII